MYFHCDEMGAALAGSPQGWYSLFDRSGRFPHENSCATAKGTSSRDQTALTGAQCDIGDPVLPVPKASAAA